MHEERIRELYPELNINHSEVIDLGQNNDVLIVNDTFVFRFPKYVEGIKKLKKETEVLEQIRGKLSLPIPYPQYKSMEPNEVGKVFTGYQRIEGTPLWHDMKKNIHNEERIASQLVQFLKELHSQPVDSLGIEKKSAEDVRNSIVGLYGKFKNKLFPYMNETSKSEIDHNLERFLSNKELLSFNTVLIHGDFGASNILWDSKREEITGIIDFGETEIGDPAYDFAGLLSSYGQPFVKRCLSMYPDGERIFERMTFYKSTFALQEALHGVENDDPEAFESGMREYR
ncbi:aminoglycoside phosphotransferase family protein [Bacillus sp. CH30_1T]|uniref:phosphotransferase family protein n=1 Tax=Bacillus sp. CH30_1T TaxID=2604836 RepID=UPI0011F00145|nr:aminoglycoside phosphotransferase family protein [Bacillus sp. CH30_1T]KAA0563543.1 aminoglycoside phosphotransferase family protein [Bacillus sp. CH30_1T]